MDGHDLLNAMHGATEFESAGDRPLRAPSAQHLSDCITHVTAGSRKMPVLKTLMTTACERGCYYCPFRAGRTAMRRVTVSPDDMASGFMALHRAGAVEGLFLSSGVIRGGVTSQDAILATGDILRNKYQFRGYLHLKIMPGAERDQVRRAMELADRVSINLEAPSQHRLERIAPGKAFAADLLTRLRWIHELRRESEGRLAASSTTEFVVGPAGEADIELLSAGDFLHRETGLARAYFSSFRPVDETPLENAAPTTALRQLRLYQASFLLRDYAFELEDLPFEAGGNLPGKVDPKRAWADANLVDAPVEVNSAPRHVLLRVPGIGLKGADRILAARRRGRLRSLEDLRAAGVVSARRTAPYVLLDGKRQVEQLRLL